MAALTRWQPRSVGAYKKRFAGKARETKLVHGLKRTGWVTGTAFALGIWNGKVGGAGARIPWIKLPADLGVGAVGYALSVWGKDRHRDTWRAVADGGLASYTSTLGVKFGNTWRSTGKLFGIGHEGEMLTGGGAIADDELARMVRA